jgi:hypothetical protein
VQDLPTIHSIYFDPTTDFGFKKLFGEEANKDLLLDFLNVLLPKQHFVFKFSKNGTIAHF